MLSSTGSKAVVTLDDLYDTTCGTHNQFSNFSLHLHCHTSCSYRVHKVGFTKYSAFKSSSKRIQEQAAAAIAVALIFEKNKSRKKR